jgi:hypothetical protein
MTATDIFVKAQLEELAKRRVDAALRLRREKREYPAYPSGHEAYEKVIADIDEEVAEIKSKDSSD